MKKRVTLKDIARETGVHVSTVSRALDPDRDVALSDGVVERVRQAVTKLGYRPNRIASSLRTKKTLIVGVMIPDITNLIFPPIVRGIESVLEPLGYASIIVNTDNHPGREERLLDILQDRGIDGIIHAAVLREDPTILRASHNGLPVITLNRKVEGAGIPCVINDEVQGIREIFGCLYNRGHRRIALLAGPESLSTGQMRTDGFRIAALEYGLDPARLTIGHAAHFFEADGNQAAAKILQAAPDTTAILCANDRLALGAIEYCHSIGRDCPTSISITGYNDMPLLELLSPKLTTVRIQQFEAGAVAARLLMGLLTGDASKVPQETILPVQLIERESVAAPSVQAISHSTSAMAKL